MQSQLLLLPIYQAGSTQRGLSPRIVSIFVGNLLWIKDQNLSQCVGFDMTIIRLLRVRVTFFKHPVPIFTRGGVCDVIWGESRAVSALLWTAPEFLLKGRRNILNIKGPHLFKMSTSVMVSLLLLESHCAWRQVCIYIRSRSFPLAGWAPLNPKLIIISVLSAGELETLECGCLSSNITWYKYVHCTGSKINKIMIRTEPIK